MSSPAALQLLQTEAEIRRLGSETELLHHLANALQPVVPHGQVWVLRESGRAHRMQVCVVSSLPVVERESPLVRCIEARVRQGLSGEGWSAATALTLRPEPDGHAGSLDHYPFGAAAWMPLPDRDGQVRAGALFVRAEPFDARALTLLGRLGETYAHAWRALPAQRSLALGGRWHRPAGLAALAACAVALCWPVPLTVMAPVEVIADDPLVVTAPIAGVVRHILPDPDTAVEAGALLVQFEDLQARNELLLQRQRLAVAQARLSRLGAAAFKDAQAGHELAMARAEFELAEVTARYAGEVLERTRVVAPQAGRVLYADRRDLEGRPVAIGQEILQVADPARVRFRIDLPVGNSIALQRGAVVRIHLDDSPAGGWPATLQTLSFQPVQRPGGELVYVLHAQRPDGPQSAGPRIGARGTAQLQGPTVRLAYQLLRRPIAAVRQTVGW